jgi:pimeloyl-ACP methyl ester carboxylesterase
MMGSPNFEQRLGNLASRTFWGQRFEISLRDARLAANLHLPPDELLAGWSKPLPVVIMLHGLGGNRHESSGNFIKAAATFALSRFAVLRFDFRGAGETGGTTRSISLEKQIDDTGHVIEFVKSDLAHMFEMPALNLNRICLMGLSMGGLTAAAVLGRRVDVCAAVLWEPPFDLMETIKRLFGPLSVNKIRTQGYFRAGMMELGPEFFECLENFSVAREVRSFDGPVLLVKKRRCGSGGNRAQLDSIIQECGSQGSPHRRRRSRFHTRHLGLAGDRTDGFVAGRQAAR